MHVKVEIKIKKSGLETERKIIELLLYFSLKPTFFRTKREKNLHQVLKSLANNALTRMKMISSFMTVVKKKENTAFCETQMRNYTVRDLTHI